MVCYVPYIQIFKKWYVSIFLTTNRVNAILLVFFIRQACPLTLFVSHLAVDHLLYIMQTGMKLNEDANYLNILKCKIREKYQTLRWYYKNVALEQKFSLTTIEN